VTFIAGASERLGGTVDIGGQRRGPPGTFASTDLDGYRHGLT
jgi:hypothetical protein